MDVFHFQLQEPSLHIPVTVLLFIHSLTLSILAQHTHYSAHTQTASHCISHLFSIRICSLFIIIVVVSEPVPPPPFFTISIPHSVLSRYIGALSIPRGRPPSGEAHFLILELPERQRVTGLGRPTKNVANAQPPSCLQEVDSRPFVFSFY